MQAYGYTVNALGYQKKKKCEWRQAVFTEAGETKWVQFLLISSAEEKMNEYNVADFYCLNF